MGFWIPQTNQEREREKKPFLFWLVLSKTKSFRLGKGHHGMEPHHHIGNMQKYLMLGNTKTTILNQLDREKECWDFHLSIYELLHYLYILCSNAFISLALHSLSSLFCSTVLSEKDFKFVARWMSLILTSFLGLPFHILLL